MAGGKGSERRSTRSYKPVVEALEALRMLSGAAAAAPAAPSFEHQALLNAPAAPAIPDFSALTGAAWDSGLLDGLLADLRVADSVEPEIVPALDEETLASGFNQLDRYLTRSWQRAGLSPQVYEDSSQAVYTTMLQQLGRARFDSMVQDVGRWGVREVLSKETAEGIDFFRAVDMVKKRVQRERAYQPLDDVVAVADGDASETKDWRDALREAIDHALTPREAGLIQDSLMGKTPAEIALDWGVAPKTVSNEKTRVLNKLREVLQTQVAD